jgi:hypothetical protein
VTERAEGVDPVWGGDLDPDLLQPDSYPRMFNISAGFMFDIMLRPRRRLPVEYVYVPAQRLERHESVGRVVLWNQAWEAGQLRNRIRPFVRDLPKELRSIVQLREDINVTFVPRWSTHRYNAYAPLFHMLPRRVVERHGLTPLTGGTWPSHFEPRLQLPADFDDRLARAFAAHVWPHLCPGSRLVSFSASEPIRLLAHNLDFWLAFATDLIQDRLVAFGRPRARPKTHDQVRKVRTELKEPNILVSQPLMGGDLWRGEEDAAEALRELVERADAKGRLRGILEAVRSNRVEEDFSSRWSYAREDFERRLYHKRRKVRVRFVELTDTIPVHGPESEVEGQMLYEDFLALLDPKEKQVVVLLRNGITRVGEVASKLGYANHSPVSKTLARIRAKAAAFFDEA